MTVFLAGSECPFTCVYCDLWQYTLDGPTPSGAIPRQLEVALAEVDPQALPSSIKLYNASNFFDPRAVPHEDLAIVASQLSGFRQVTVECHPRLVGEPCLQFARQIAGELEVAMGLETIHPDALPRLNKQMTLTDFEAALHLLTDHEVGARAFALLSPPFVPAEESVDWTIRTVEYALNQGVGVVSVIPTRPGSGEMARLGAAGLFEPPTLEMLEQVMMGSLAVTEGIVLADLWDVETMRGCDECRGHRIANLRQINRTGLAGPSVHCGHCSPAKQGGE